VVRVGLSTAFAMPKSVRTTRSSGPSKILAGFTSRCTTPAWCAARSPAKTPRPIRATRADGRGPWSRTVSRSDWNGTSSITMAGRPSSSKKSYTPTTFGWRSRATICASRTARRRTISRSASSMSGGQIISLTATSRLSSSSRARQTAPMPPRPITARSRYRPASRRSVSGADIPGHYPGADRPNGAGRAWPRMVRQIRDSKVAAGPEGLIGSDGGSAADRRGGRR
jgi:hypothetical protein